MFYINEDILYLVTLKFRLKTLVTNGTFYWTENDNVTLNGSLIVPLSVHR